MKYFVMIILASTVFTFTAKANAEIQSEDLNRSATIGPIERDDRGEIIRLYQDEAIEHCETKGSRLPTAREYALFALEFGAKEVSETENDRNYLVKGSDSEGNPDYFYFDSNGYYRPSNDLGRNWFWTSSNSPDYAEFAYVFNGILGYVSYGYRNGYNGSDRYYAVRCIVIR